MRIAIVDDIAEERKTLRKRLERQLDRRSLHANIYEYESGESFLAAATEQTFTVLFLDIYMKGASGIETAKKLRVFDTECLLIFTTSSPDHALEGFRVRAMHYLVKPYSEEDIDTLIDEIIQRSPIAEKYIDIKVDKSNIRLPFKDIIYAEHFPHRMQIMTVNDRTLSTRQTFGEFSSLLKEDERFFVCSRGVIVNLEHISDLNGTTFIMDDGSTIGISRDLLKTARQTFMDFLFKRRR